MQKEEIPVEVPKGQNESPVSGPLFLFQTWSSLRPMPVNFHVSRILETSNDRLLLGTAKPNGVTKTRGDGLEQG